MKKPFSVISFLILIFLCVSSLAQEKEISLKRYSSSDGLPDNSVHCVYFDSKGFLWIGTEEGLSRFDGEEFISYKANNGFGLSGNVVRDISEDKEGWLWLATQDGGVCRLNPLTGEVFHPVLPSYGGSEQNCAYSLWLSLSGGMVVGTDKGIYISQDRINFKMADGKNLSACYDIIQYGDKALTAENRWSSRLIDQHLSLSSFVTSKADKPFNVSSLNSIYHDSENRFWLAGWNNHLHEYLPQNGEVRSYDFMSVGPMSWSKDELRCLTEALPGKLWIGMKSGQLWEFDKQTQKAHRIIFSRRESGKMYGSKIQCLYTDKQGRTWIGTNNGLHVFDLTTSRFDVEFLKENYAVSGFERAGDKLFAGTLGALYEIDGDSCVLKIGGVQIYSLLSLNSEELLLGTINSVKLFNTEAKKVSYPLQTNFSTGFQVNNVGSSRYNFLYSNHNRLAKQDYRFANAYGHGLIVMDSAFQWVMFQIENQDGYDNLLNGVFIDSKQNLWILGSLTGLMLAEPLNLGNYQEKKKSPKLPCKAVNKGLRSKNITAMTELDDQSLWVTTLGGGLYKFSPENRDEQYQHIPSPFQSIRSMVKDNSDNLWMVASGVLLCYEPKNEKWSKFDERDGIPKEGLNGSLFCDSDGSIYAGGNGFIVHFKPGDIVLRKERPNTTITHLRIMDQQRDDLLLNKVIHLPYDNNFISIDFASLCFSNAASTRFQYKLKGVDKEWRDNGTLNSVSYSALSPGKYEFQVKAISVEGLEDSQGALLLFTIATPFYATWWFISLLIASLGLIAWLIYRARKKQDMQLEFVRNKIARDLHDDIGSALGSISFFSETAKRTLDSNQKDDTSLVLDKIGSTSREMIENMHDIVWAVNPINDSFDHVLHRMKNYCTDLCAANNIKLIFKEQDNLSGVKLTMAERKNIFLIFKEALYNSSKYASCSEIRISIEHNRYGKIKLTITDNGSGFDVDFQKSSGNGLRNMRNRADEIGAIFLINSETAVGTTIVVTL